MKQRYAFKLYIISVFFFFFLIAENTIANLKRVIMKKMKPDMFFFWMDMLLINKNLNIIKHSVTIPVRTDP